MKYETKKVDYSKCKDQIANALSSGKIIKCHVSDSETHPTDKEWIVAYIPGKKFGYIDDDGVTWKYALPIEVKTYVKSAVEVMKYLVSDGYTVQRDGNWININGGIGGKYGFVTDMWQYCGKEKPDVRNWPKGTLEER